MWYSHITTNCPKWTEGCQMFDCSSDDIIISSSAYVSSGSDYCFDAVSSFFFVLATYRFLRGILERSSHRRTTSVVGPLGTYVRQRYPYHACRGHRSLNPPKMSEVRANVAGKSNVLRKNGGRRTKTKTNLSSTDP